MYMYIFLSVLVISVSAVAIAAIICYKGIRYHKIMEVVQPKPQLQRSEHMDEIECKLNEVTRLNEQHLQERQPEAIHTVAGRSPMDAAMLAVQRVFGPEQPPHKE